jgi:hypothetical protein
LAALAVGLLVGAPLAAEAPAGTGVGSIIKASERYVTQPGLRGRQEERLCGDLAAAAAGAVDQELLIGLFPEMGSGSAVVALVSPTGLVVAAVINGELYILRPGGRLVLLRSRSVPANWRPGRMLLLSRVNRLVWSPDGRFLAFWRGGMSDGNEELCIVAADGSSGRKVRLDGSSVYRPDVAWTEANDLLVWRAVEGRQPHQWELWRFPPGAGAPAKVDAPPAAAETIFTASPIVLDGRVAFHRDGDVWLRADGKTRNLTGGRLGAVWPLCWMDGGRGMACRSAADQDKHFKVWGVAVEGPAADASLADGVSVDCTWAPVPVSDWLPPLPDEAAAVAVESEPAGAEVYVNGHFKGFTPCRVTVASAQKHFQPYIFSFMKDYLRMETRHLCLRRGDTAQLHVTLSTPLTRRGAPQALGDVRNKVRRAIVHRDPKLLASLVSPSGAFGGGEERLPRDWFARGGDQFVETVFFSSFREAFLQGCVADDAQRYQTGGWTEGWVFEESGEILVQREGGNWWLTGFNGIGWLD